MKKQVFSNGSVEEPTEDLFIKTLVETTSVVDFYKHKEEIIKRLQEACK